MKLDIKVIPNAKRNEIKKEGERYKVYLTAPVVDGKANKKLVELLYEQFGVRKNCVFIKRGAKSRHKVVVVRK